MSLPGYYKTLFFLLVLSNVTLREHDVEQFEDDPLEFIRLDLSISASGSGTDLATRRQAAADVLHMKQKLRRSWMPELAPALRSTMPVGRTKKKTEKQKTVPLTAVATRGSTTQVEKFFLDMWSFFANFLFSGKHGVTSTVTLRSMLSNFSDHVFENLQAAPGTVNSSLQVDAIRFLLTTFRNQVETSLSYFFYLS
jgi:exportin-2 (importin alpha re-exporter)